MLSWGLSSPRKEKHWESVPAVAAKSVQISCQDFGKDREMPHKSLSIPIPHVFLCPLSQILKEEMSQGNSVPDPSGIDGLRASAWFVSSNSGIMQHI